MQWFRFHAETVNNPKVQRMKGDEFKAWVNFMCVACQSGGLLPSLSDLSFILRIPEKRVMELISILGPSGYGLIDREDDRFMMHDWNGWQFKSDRSTERVKKFRKRFMAVSETENETPLSVSVSVSESEKEKKDELFSLDEPPFDPPWEEEVERVAERIWGRHGAFRRCAREVVKAKLRTICMDVPEPERVAALHYIDIQHDKMKRSEDWTKDGGAYIKGLDAWLNPKNRLWENEPRSSVKVEAHNPYRLVDSLGEGGAA